MKPKFEYYKNVIENLDFWNTPTMDLNDIYESIAWDDDISSEECFELYVLWDSLLKDAYHEHGLA